MRRCSASCECVRGRYLTSLTRKPILSLSPFVCHTHTHTHVLTDLRSLVEQGADLNQRDSLGRTAALHAATKGKHSVSLSLFFLCKCVHVCVSVSVRQCVSVLSLFGVSQGHLPIASSAGLRTTLISHSSGGNSEIVGGDHSLCLETSLHSPGSMPHGHP